MTEQTKTRFPAPLYAAAGAGDLAYQQLRKLPAVVNQLSERAAASLRVANEQAGTKASQLRERAQTTDFDALRGNAASVASTFAQIAQDRAVSIYTALVERGERVVGALVATGLDGLGVPYVQAIALWAIAIGSFVTLVQRVWMVRGVLLKGEAAE